jgi:hypothetical protein
LQYKSIRDFTAVVSLGSEKCYSRFILDACGYLPTMPKQAAGNKTGNNIFAFSFRGLGFYTVQNKD